MKNLIKAFWREALIIVFIVSAISGFGIDACSDQRHERIASEKAENANIAALRAFLIDSTQTAEHRSNIAKLDSAKAAESLKTEKYKANAEKFKQEAYGLRKTNNGLRNKLDSMLVSGTATCGEMLGASLELNDSLRAENTKLDSALIEVDKEAQSYSQRLWLSEQASAEKDSVVQKHEKYIGVLQNTVSNLQCYREWGNNHRFLKWLFGWKCRK